MGFTNKKERTRRRSQSSHQETTSGHVLWPSLSYQLRPKFLNLQMGHFHFQISAID
jgi:hypothetical protein